MVLILINITEDQLRSKGTLRGFIGYFRLNSHGGMGFFSCHDPILFAFACCSANSHLPGSLSILDYSHILRPRPGARWILTIEAAKENGWSFTKKRVVREHNHSHGDCWYPVLRGAKQCWSRGRGVPSMQVGIPDAPRTMRESSLIPSLSVWQYIHGKEGKHGA